jgi:DNA-binding transcriptional LysR family regulator
MDPPSGMRSLNLASSSGVGLHVLGHGGIGPHLIAFRQQYPEIELELDFSDLLMNLIDEAWSICRNRRPPIP